MRRLRVAAWVAAAALLVGGAEWKLAAARRTAHAQANDPAVAAEWDRWRRDAAKQDGKPHDGAVYPVQRAAPRAERPPFVVLLTDHYPTLAVALAAGILAPLGFLTVVVEASIRQGSSRNSAPRAASPSRAD